MIHNIINDNVHQEGLNVNVMILEDNSMWKYNMLINSTTYVKYASLFFDKI